MYVSISKGSFTPIIFFANSSGQSVLKYVPGLPPFLAMTPCLFPDNRI